MRGLFSAFSETLKTIAFGMPLPLGRPSPWEGQHLGKASALGRPAPWMLLVGTPGGGGCVRVCVCSCIRVTAVPNTKLCGLDLGRDAAKSRKVATRKIHFSALHSRKINVCSCTTLVVKIKKTQESTPRFLKRITEHKENILLLPVDPSWPCSCDFLWCSPAIPGTR
jgi:hypothetical protein